MKSSPPDAGDIVWLQFNPQAGRGQAGHRPAVVLTGEPASVALVDHVKSLDLRERKASIKGQVATEELAAIRGKLHALIGGSD